MFPTRAVNSLLHILIGEHTKDNRAVMIYIQILKALCYSLAYKIKVFCFPFNYTSNSNNCIKHIITLLHLFTTIHEFKTSGYVPANYIFIDNTVFFKSVKCSLK